MENQENREKKRIKGEDKEMKYFFMGVWGGAFLLFSFLMFYVKPLLVGLFDSMLGM